MVSDDLSPVSDYAEIDLDLLVTRRFGNVIPMELVTLTINRRDLKTIFQRGLNTWSDVPPYLLLLADEIEKL